MLIKTVKILMKRLETKESCKSRLQTALYHIENNYTPLKTNDYDLPTNMDPEHRRETILFLKKEIERIDKWIRRTRIRIEKWK